MSFQGHVYSRKAARTQGTVNVVDLIHRAKIKEKKEKRQNIIIAAVAVSALAVSGFIISL